MTVKWRRKVRDWPPFSLSDKETNRYHIDSFWNININPTFFRPQRNEVGVILHITSWLPKAIMEELKYDASSA
jgi:hypothetical protein